MAVNARDDMNNRIKTKEQYKQGKIPKHTVKNQIASMSANECPERDNDKGH